MIMVLNLGDRKLKEKVEDYDPFFVAFATIIITLVAGFSRDIVSREVLS